MARLTLPDAGTVVTVQGELEGVYRSRGWVDVEAPEKQDERPRRGRPRKSE
jgi:hypothetical protein